jgi:hypothetical protein
LKEGVADWRTPDSGKVTGRLMVTSHDRAMARNFSCGTYYGICDLLIESLLEDIPDGATAQMYAATANYCDFNPNAQTKCINGSPTSGSVNYYWTVGATSIIALNSSSQQIVSTPKLKGVSPGSGYANVEAEAGSSIAKRGRHADSGAGLLCAIEVPQHR